MPPLPPPRTFLSNHSHVLFCLADDLEMRLRDVAERAVYRMVADLEEVGVLTRQKEGRRNSYEVHGDKPLRHAIEAHRTVGDLLKLLG